MSTEISSGPFDHDITTSGHIPWSTFTGLFPWLHTHPAKLIVPSHRTCVTERSRDVSAKKHLRATVANPSGLPVLLMGQENPDRRR